jgi:small subunit ribosomal protein S8
MYTDTIADYLTRIRNALHAGHKVVYIPYSKFKKEITQILLDQGYILSYNIQINNKEIKIALKYDIISREPVIKSITRVSKPGLRKYRTVSTLPIIINGLGIAIVSTSKGLMIDKHAREINIGGEIICYVY